MGGLACPDGAKFRNASNDIGYPRTGIPAPAHSCGLVFSGYIVCSSHLTCDIRHRVFPAETAKILMLPSERCPPEVWACVRLFLCLTIVISLVSASAEPRLQQSADVSRAVLAIPKPNLRRIIRDSGRIFAGTVIKVERVDPSPDSAIATTQ